MMITTPEILCLASTAAYATSYRISPRSRPVAAFLRLSRQEILSSSSPRLFSLMLPYSTSAGRRNMSVLSGSGSSDDHHYSVSDDNSAATSEDKKPSPPQNCIHVSTTFEGKVVPLGDGDFTVRRILPNFKQRSVGPFVFLDHFGPTPFEQHAMNVGPHPHIGLMTITYLYEGAILHRDSTSAEQLVVPGDVNGMISGRGVVHSERGLLQDIQPHLTKLGLPPPTSSHGLQIWMALSQQGEDVDPSFHHGPAVKFDDYATLVVGQANNQKQMCIPIDENLGRVAYVDVHLPQAGETFTLHSVGGEPSTSKTAKENDDDGDVSIELGVYVSKGMIRFLGDGWGEKVVGTTLEQGNMLVVNIPNNKCSTEFAGTIEAMSSYGTRVAMLGGTPLPQKRQMYWNFVSTSREKVEEAARAWEGLDRNVFGKVVNESNDDTIPLPPKRKSTK